MISGNSSSSNSSRSDSGNGAKWSSSKTGLKQAPVNRQIKGKITGRNLTRKLKTAEADSYTSVSTRNVNNDVRRSPRNHQPNVGVCDERRFQCPMTYSCMEDGPSSYKCFCPYSGVILDAEQNVSVDCLPGTVHAPPKDSNGVDGVISNSEMRKIFNTTEGATQKLHPHNGGGHLSVSMTVAITLSSAVFILMLFLLLYWLRRRHRKRYSQEASGGFSIWCDCLWRRPKNSIGLQALGKSSVLDNQQFTANPNYYSAPPEMAILKSLMHLEIAGDRLAFMDVIGEGCFGKVFKGALRKDESELCDVAIKILKENSTNEIQVDFLREVEIMSSFKHQNILELLGVVVVENGATPWMVFEFMEFGDLAELLRENSPYFWNTSKSPCKITKDDLPWLATQVASGMTYLSSQHFVHRDLATRNCLVGKGPTIKISDFGMSRDIYTSDYYKIGGSRMLPVRWMAPESVMYGKFTLETDVWSFGVVVWEIFAYGKQPYYGHSNEEVVKLIRQGILLSPPEDCPYYVCQLMEACWRTNPYDRIKFAQIYDVLTSQYPHLDPLKSKPVATQEPNGKDIANSRLGESADDSFSNYLIPRTISATIGAE